MVHLGIGLAVAVITFVVFSWIARRAERRAAERDRKSSD